MHTWCRITFSCVLLFAFAGCATVKGWAGRGEDAPAQTTPEVAEAAPVEGVAEDPEASLRRVVDREIAAADHQSAANTDQLVRQRPYWLKEYVEYPEDAANIRIDLQETESRTRPYIADVKVAKVRYATKLHRERNAAASDTNFFRHTGEETLTYEHRGGRWVRVGSLFVADTTEEKLGGAWQPVQEEPETMETAVEPERGIFDRTFGWILGR